MAIILNIESATEVCSIALSDAGKTLAIEESREPNMHAARITLLIEACLRDAGLDMEAIKAIAVSAGPGSYTSLRVGAAAAKGIGYAFGIPLIAVDTLKSLAWACREKYPYDPGMLFCPMIDARRMEVYTAVYDTDFNVVEPVHALVLEKDSFDKYFNEGKTIIFSGNGSLKCQELFPTEKAVFLPVFCSAANLIAMSSLAFLVKDFVDIAYFTPNYGKPPNITTPKG